MDRTRLMTLALALLLAAPGCPTDTADDDAPPGPPPEDPITPAVVEAAEVVPVDCTGAYELPEEFTGPDGLGHHGWTVDDLRFHTEWNVDNLFVNSWISDNEDEGLSIRIHPHLVPEAGYCYQGELAFSAEGVVLGEPVLGHLVQDVTAFSHTETYYDELEKDGRRSADYDLSGGLVLLQALRGLHGLPNPYGGAPEVDAWTDADTDAVKAAIADYPQDWQQALAALVLSIGEANLLKQQALAGADGEIVDGLHGWLQDDDLSNRTVASFAPASAGTLAYLEEHADTVDLRRFMEAGIAVADAADRVAVAMPAPFDSPGIDLLTPHGRIVIRTTEEDDEYGAEELDDVVLLVDVGGADTYHGQYAATQEYWMSAAVVVDGAGDDRYGPDTPDIEDGSLEASDVFDPAFGYTQGYGLFGAGVLVDAAGDDTYRASVHAQGGAQFGVGALLDRGGSDQYRVGYGGIGAAMFGVGVAVDTEGDDFYGLYVVGQGNGRAKGHGLLLDLEGHDEYLSYYQALEPYLPEPGYPNWYEMTPGDQPYNDGENAHYMSWSQGCGHGYRHEWMNGATWMGGMGALVDLGEGDDVHLGDNMTMALGYVYGFGFLYDGGGNDSYASFWWGPSASPHMGTNLLIEEDGDDTIRSSWASGGWGYDASIGWTLDHGGNDTYGGQFHYGYAYAWADTFLINIGGDDVYNDDGAQGDAYYGVVRDGSQWQKLCGAFLDLGGGDDEYNTGHEIVGNDRNWYHEAFGDNVLQSLHKGIGIDR